ncbi:MAG: ATP phosphoribosyltransferase [Hyphomicrobiales bacterium]|nr:ATP phosphoribosyltransferase [Hyphomicrobiales bacterium]PCJ96004.1 MAG: ATP phosphoribosyltransferase [Hyphomicrobiales bacterium]
MSNLVLAIPSKGRLKEQAEAVFTNAGFCIESDGSSRSYFGKLTGLSNGEAVDISFLSAGEIAREAMRGSIHLGITGEDLVRETLRLVDEKIAMLMPLGFGFADVVVAVPDSWVDVHVMEDLDDVAADFRRSYGRRMRVATKYWMLTQAYFAKHGLGVYRIVESLGATEGAPAAGSADIIVDITSTGSTLFANHLKILDDGIILKSEANLIGSKTASWSDKAKAQTEEILTRLGAAKPLSDHLS